MHQCNGFVNFSGLLHLPIHGKKYTWHNAESGSRIDRALVNSFAGTFWTFMNLVAFPRRLLDHNPILLSADKEID